MGLSPKKKKKKTFFSTGILVEECCDKIPFCNIGRLYKGFFSLFQGVCVCVFLKSDDCIVKEEGKKREKDTEADPREKKKERKKKRKEKERR